MTTKETDPALAAKTDPADVAKRHGRAGQKAGHRHVSAENPGTDPVGDTANDSAEYIAVLASQLRRIAETNGHEFLAYLIDMVVLEAWRIAGPDADYPDKNANGTGSGRA